MKIVVTQNQGMPDGVPQQQEAVEASASNSAWDEVVDETSGQPQEQSIDEKFYNGTTTPEPQPQSLASVVGAKVLEIADSGWNSLVTLATGNDPRDIQNPTVTTAENTYVQNITATEEFSTTASEVISKVAKTEDEIRALIDDEVIAVAQKYNIDLTNNPEININELEELLGGHMQEASEFATNIYVHLPDDMKESLSLEELQLGAMLHDYGKVVIPSEILNKPGRLTDEEFAKMKGHAELGALLLEKQGLVSKDVLDIVEYHHQNLKNKGYPALKEGEELPLSAQVLMGSDIFSALMEKRTYKPAYSKRFSLELLYNQHVKEGKLDKKIYDVLESFAATLPEPDDAYDGPEDPPKNYKNGQWLDQASNFMYNNKKNIATNYAINNDATVVKYDRADGYTIVGIRPNPEEVA